MSEGEGGSVSFPDGVFKNLNWKRDPLIALITVLLTAGGGFATGVLDYKAQAEEDEFDRLERITNRLERRVDYWSARAIRAETRNDSLAQRLDELEEQMKSQIRQLKRENYRLEQRLEDQEKGRLNRKLPPLPPKEGGSGPHYAISVLFR